MRNHKEIIGLLVGVLFMGACRKCSDVEPSDAGVVDVDSSVTVPVIELGDAEVLALPDGE